MGSLSLRKNSVEIAPGAFIFSSGQRAKQFFDLPFVLLHVSLARSLLARTREVRTLLEGEGADIDSISHAYQNQAPVNLMGGGDSPSLVLYVSPLLLFSPMTSAG